MKWMDFNVVHQKVYSRKKKNTSASVVNMSYGQAEFSQGVLAIPLATQPRVFLWTYSLELDGKEVVSHFQSSPTPGYSLSKHKKIKTGMDCNEFYTLAKDERSCFCLENVIFHLRKMQFAFPWNGESVVKQQTSTFPPLLAQHFSAVKEHEIPICHKGILKFLGPQSHQAKSAYQ